MTQHIEPQSERNIETSQQERILPSLAALKERLGTQPEPSSYVPTTEQQVVQSREDMADMTEDLIGRALALAWYAGMIPTHETAREGFTRHNDLTIPLSPNLTLGWTEEHDIDDPWQTYVLRHHIGAEERSISIRGYLRNYLKTIDDNTPDKVSYTYYAAKPTDPGPGRRVFGLKYLNGDEVIVYNSIEQRRETTPLGCTISAGKLPRQSDGMPFRVLDGMSVVSGRGTSERGSIETSIVSTEVTEAFASTIFATLIDEIRALERYGVRGLPELPSGQ